MKPVRMSQMTHGRKIGLVDSLGPPSPALEAFAFLEHSSVSTFCVGVTSDRAYWCIFCSCVRAPWSEIDRLTAEHGLLILKIDVLFHIGAQPLNNEDRAAACPLDVLHRARWGQGSRYDPREIAACHRLRESLHGQNPQAELSFGVRRRCLHSTAQPHAPIGHRDNHGLDLRCARSGVVRQQPVGDSCCPVAT